MDKQTHPAPCDLAEVFSQLERADAVTLRRAQMELARMQKDKVLMQKQESPESD